ncbi:hypothetical protein B0O80DRAFT_424662 [Mortierella sp. GBAus27b]|nr:hypothetical protein BGX31_007061 [Mortierella sp. GBA43]KAI8357669.1 hypothetical protein B0O80DRAFT_424662 [Mortierella sp. GBAus27b]
MTVPESSIPVITTAVVPTETSTKAHFFVRGSTVDSSASGGQPQDGHHVDERNGRVSVLPTAGFSGGLLVGLYDPHLGPQCAQYLQQHLVPILDESLSTQLDHDSSDTEDHPGSSQQTSPEIDPTQVVDTLKATFKELDELLLAAAITVALTVTIEEIEPEDELFKTREIVERVVTGSSALVGFLAPHRTRSSIAPSATAATTTGTVTEAAAGERGDSVVQRHDFYMAQLGDSVAILAGYDDQGNWSARRLNPPETHEHSVRYPGSKEYRKVISEAKERAVTIEQYLTQHNGDRRNSNVHYSSSSAPSSSSSSQSQPQSYSSSSNGNSNSNSTSANGDSLFPQDTFLTKNGRFLGLPVTRAFGDLDWKLEQEARFSVAAWVEGSLKDKISQALRPSQGYNQDPFQDQVPLSQLEQDINNLSDPPYVEADPRISRFVLETRKPSSTSTSSHSGPSDQLLILLSRGLLYTTRALTTASTSTPPNGKVNPYNQPLISDMELSRAVAESLEKGDENCAAAVAKVLDEARRNLGGDVVIDKHTEDEGREGSVVVIVL